MDEKIRVDELLRKAEALYDDIVEMESIDIPKAYSKLKKQMDNSSDSSRKLSRIIPISTNSNLKHIFLYEVAAILSIPLLFIGMLFGYLYFHSEYQNYNNFAEVRASNGTIVKYELPDHSEVWLNSGSKLEYPLKFRKKSRNVKLTGEAFFSVQANSKSPFNVNTASGVVVTAYGTKFNVSAYSDNDDVEVLLEEGSVTVRLPHEEGELVMKPEDFALCDPSTGRIIKSTADIYEKTGWKDGKLIFRDANLNEIFRKLERHFNVNIIFHNHSGNDYRYRATFRDETLDQILDYLSKSVKMEWTISKSDGISNSSIKTILITIN